MNDDLHKTFEPESVPDDLINNGDAPAEGWKMPEPVFRRSSGRASGGPASEPQKAPTTFVPERMAKKAAEAGKPPDPPAPDVEPQPSLADHFKTEEEIVTASSGSAQTRSKLYVGIAAAAVLLLIGIVLAVLVAAYLGYVLWR